MPELPDITVYIEHLEKRLTGSSIERIRISSPFLLRTVTPPVREAEGKNVHGFRRIGKQIVWELDGGLFLILHLMISGRLHWKAAGAKVAGKIALAGFDFKSGTLLLTEASSKKRASLYLVHGEDSLAQFNKGGIEPLSGAVGDFRSALFRENHTLKRSLTDQRLFSGIGNAYSDEILHRARLSPLQKSKNLSDEEIERLFDATTGTLQEWLNRLRAQSGDAFPEKVTAFRPEMAVHGKFGKPCPVCSTKIQRIAYADNECNYCPRCQTGGRLLSDRSLARLLRDDWPSTIDELEAHPALSKSR